MPWARPFIFPTVQVRRGALALALLLVGGVLFAALGSSAAPSSHLQVEVSGSVTAGHPLSIRIRARDDGGAVDTGYRGTVHFTSSDPGATLPADYTFTAADNGDRTFTPGVTYRSPGNQRVSAADASQPSIRGDAPATLVYPAATTLLQVDVSAGSITAGQPVSLRIRARNNRGDIDTGYRGTVHFTSTDPAATVPADYTFTAADNGDHTLSDVIVYRTGGDQAVSAADTANPAIRGDTVSTLVFTFAATHLEVAAGGGSVTAGQPVQIRIRARDDRGDVDPGYRGTVHFTSTDPAAILPADYTFTAADNGDRTFTPGVTYRTRGNQSVTATDTGHPAVRGDAASTLVFAATATRLEIDAPGGSISAGDPANLRVRARNNRGDIDTGYVGTVHFTSTDPRASIPADYTFTPSDHGDHSFADGVTFATAGQQAVTVFDTAHPDVRDDSISTLVVSLGATRLELDGPGGTVTAGQPFDLRVIARDERGDVDTGYAGTVHFTTTDRAAGASVPADYTFTAADAGNHVFPGGVVFVSPGDQAVSASDVSRPGVRGDSASTLVFASAATHLEVSGLSSSNPPGTPDSFRIRALNDRNDVDTSYAGTVTFSSSDAAAALPASYTFTPGDAGDHTFTPGVTFQTPGSQTVLATDAAHGIRGLSPASLIGSAPALQVDVFSSSETAGLPVDLRVTALNAAHATDTGFRGTVHFTSSDAGATLPPDYTFTAADNGAHVFSGATRFAAAGSQTVTAADTTDASRRGSDSLLVFAKAATHFNVVVFDGSVSTGHPVSVRVQAVNDGNDIDTRYRGTVHFTSTDPAAILPADYTFTAADNGQHTFTDGVTYITAGDRSVAVAESSRPGVRGDSGATSVTASPATFLRVDVFDGSVTAGHPVGLRVRAFDFNGDVDTAYRGTVHFTSTDPAATLPADYTFTAADNGDHTFANAVTYATPGNRSVSVNDAARPGIRGDSGSTLVYSPAATHLVVDVFSGQVTASQPIGMRVRAYNDNGDIDTGYRGTIHFTSTDPAATLPPDYTFTAGDAGDRTFANGVVYATPGNRSLAAAETAHPTVRGDSGDTLVLFTGASHLEVDVFAGNITAGRPTGVRVRARNDNGDIDPAYHGTIHFTSTDPGAVLPADYTFTAGDNGDHTFTDGVTYATAGNRSLAVADTARPTLRGDSGDTSVFAAAATHLDVEAFTGSTSPGTPFTVRVTARNDLGDIDTGYRGTVHFSATDTGAVVPADDTFTAGDNGQRTFTDGASLATPGNQALAAADTAGGSTVRGFSADVFVPAGPPPSTTTIATTSTSSTSTTSTSTTTTTVNPNAATHLDVEIFTGQVTAGHPVDMRVTARDASNQIAASYTGTVRFTSTDAGASLPATYTFTPGDAGRHTFTGGVAFATPGNQRVTGTDTSATSLTGSTGPILVLDANATHFDVEPSAGTVTAGQPVDLRITARNDNNDIDQAYRGTVHITSTDGTATLPADYTFTAGDTGRHTFAQGVRFSTPGNQTVTATDMARTTVRGTSGPVSVQPAAATHFEVGLSSSTAASGQPVDVTVTAVGTNGSVDTAYAGTVHFSSTDPSAVLPANYTFTAGDAGRHTFAGGVRFQTSGNQTVTVTDSASATVTGTSSAVLVNPPPPSSTTTTSTSSSTTSSSTSTSTSTTTTRPPSTTTTTPPCNPPTVNVQPASLRAGDKAMVSGCGFGANTSVRLDFFSTPVFLGTTQSDASGNYFMAVVIPVDAAAGNHHIVASGPNAQSVASQGSGAVFVEGPPLSTPPGTNPAGPPVDPGTSAPGTTTATTAPGPGGTGTPSAPAGGTGPGSGSAPASGPGVGTGGISPDLGGTAAGTSPDLGGTAAGTSPDLAGTTGGGPATQAATAGGAPAGTGTGGGASAAAGGGQAAGSAVGAGGATSSAAGGGAATGSGANGAGPGATGPVAGTPGAGAGTAGGRAAAPAGGAAAGPGARTPAPSAAARAQAEGIGVAQGDRSALVTAVREPDQIATDAKTVAVNVLLALGLIVLIGFPADLFNGTLMENYDEITGWFRFRRRAGIASFEQGFDRLPTALRLGVYGFLGAVLYGLLDPKFGFNRHSLVLLLGLLGALAVISCVLDLLRNTYLDRRAGKRGRLKAYPAGLVIGAILVFFSRVGHFHPGYVFGIFTGLAFEEELGDDEDGRALFVGGLALLGVAVVALLLRIPVAHRAAQPGAGFGVLVLDAALATLWLAGIQAIVWGLMPIKFLYGKSVLAWNKVGWFALYGAGMVLFVHTLVHPALGLYGTSSRASLFSVLLLFLCFGAFSVVFWAYFRFRHPRPPLLEARPRQEPPLDFEEVIRR